MVKKYRGTILCDVMKTSRMKYYPGREKVQNTFDGLYDTVIFNKINSQFYFSSKCPVSSHGSLLIPHQSDLWSGNPVNLHDSLLIAPALPQLRKSCIFT